MSKLLTREDVAKKLMMSVQTVDRLIKSGTLKATKLGHFVRIKEEDLEELLKGK